MLDVVFRMSKLQSFSDQLFSGVSPANTVKREKILEATQVDSISKRLFLKFEVLNHLITGSSPKFLNIICTSIEFTWIAKIS